MFFVSFSLKSLRARISFAVFSIYILGLVSAFIYLNQTVHNDVKSLIEKQHSSATSIIAADLNIEIKERLYGLEKAADGATKAMLAGPEAIQALIEQSPALQSMFNGGVTAYRLDGTAVADFPLSIHRRGSNQMNIAVVKTALEDGRTTIGSPLVDDKLKSAVFHMGSPIHGGDKKIIGALIGVVNLDQPNFIDQIIATRHYKSVEYIVVSPKQRMIVTGSNKHRNMEILPASDTHITNDLANGNASDTFISKNALGIEQLTSLKAIPAAGWYLEAFSPTSEAFAPLQTMEHRLLFIALFMTIMGGGLSWWLLKRQLAPMARAALSLKRMKSGKTNLQPLPITNDDEVGQLITGFNQLLITLEQRESSLRDSQFFFQESQRAASIGSYRCDFIADYWETSDVCDQVFGIDSTYNTNVQGWINLIHPDDIDHMTQYLTTEVIEQNKPFNKEYRVIRPSDNKTRWVHGLGKTISDEQGVCIGLIGTIQDITERKETSLTLAHERSIQATLLNTLPDLIWLKDLEGTYLRCNHRFEHFFGTLEADIIGKTDYDFVNKELADFFRQNDLIAIENNHPSINEEKVRFNSDGHYEVLETTKVPLRNAKGEVIGVMGIGHNITEQKKTASHLQLAASVFTHAREGIMITDPTGSIIEVNDTFCHITGYSREEIIGENPRFLKSGHQTPGFYNSMWESLLENKHWHGELWNRRKNGEVFAELITISAVCDTNGIIQSYVALFTDITPMKEHQQQLEHIAHYDALTNLPNRSLLADRLEQAIARSERHHQSVAVAYLDIDGFKLINDTHGHDRGDDLLTTLSHHMKAALREGDTLARIGGDEFVAVLADLKKVTDCEPVLKRLLQAASTPIIINDITLHASASIGVTIYPQDGVDADQLVRHADQAMYIAKQSGKNRYHIFDVNQDAAIKLQRESLELIQLALERHEFVLYYQPKVNMRTGQVIGAEALIRWQHPKRGVLLPEDFLPIIENRSLCIDIGEWVLDTALTQMAEWQSAGLSIPVSVNVGARQLQQKDFTSKLSAALAKHPDISPTSLELEILETSALEDIAKVSAIMQACHKIGVSFAIDDFGTGYSSLTYLRRLPAELLKIDQSFVRNMLSDPDDRTIVTGIISLASAFQRQVIAEGVETIDHGTQLLAMGCVLAQGYGIARPMPGTEIPAWVSQWKPDIAWKK